MSEAQADIETQGGTDEEIGDQASTGPFAAQPEDVGSSRPLPPDLVTQIELNWKSIGELEPYGRSPAPRPGWVRMHGITVKSSAFVEEAVKLHSSLLTPPSMNWLSLRT